MTGRKEKERVVNWREREKNTKLERKKRDEREKKC